MSDTYCPLPWVHTSLQNGNTILPCCAFMDSSIGKPGKFDELFNSDEMNNIRKNMISGKKIKGCEQCYAQEKSGMQSMRNRAVKQYGYVTEINLKDIHLIFDNLCNLKCRMCSSASSHLWYTEEQQIYGTSFAEEKYFQNTMYKEINFKNIESINITGGEPIYSPHFIPFLKKIQKEADLNNVTLGFFTNGTIKPTDNIIELLKSFKKVNITISIDAIGELNNFIRNNSDFNVIEKNLNFYHNLVDDRFSVNILTTVGIYNAISVDATKSFFHKNYPKFYWWYDLIQYLEHLSLKNMPIELKKIYSKYITDESLLSFMNEEGKDLFPHFLYFHKKLNDLRKEDFVGNDILAEYIKSNQHLISEEASVLYYKQVFNEIKNI
jgi:MoaA/NifB/PqqE/SkfB family radical SAM enzyme